MKHEVRDVYTCDHCKKKYLVKSACEKHEHWCYKNPKNEIACFKGCTHLSETTIEIETDYQGIKNVTIPYCKKLEIEMFTLGAERKGHAKLFESLGQYPMPKVECEHFKDWFSLYPDLFAPI